MVDGQSINLIESSPSKGRKSKMITINILGKKVLLYVDVDKKK
jgi:hypothetical protein